MEGNLKILAVNDSDNSTLDVTSRQTLYPVSNLQVQQLSSRWRSTDATDQTITIDSPVMASVSGFSLHALNVTYGSTIKLQLFQKESLDNTVTNNVSDILTFSSPHNIPQTRFDEYWVSVQDDNGAYHVKQVVAWVNSLSVQIEPLTGSFTYPALAVTLHQVFADTVEGVDPLYGWGEQPWGFGRWYGYDGSNPKGFVTLWFSEVSFDYAAVTIADPQNTDGFIEAGRLWLGLSLAPKYNMLWGAGINMQSQTTVTRTRAGSLVSDNRPSFRTAQFQLAYMPEDEALNLFEMIDAPSNKSDSLLAMYPSDQGRLGQYTTMLGRIIGHSALTRGKTGYSMSIDFQEGL